MLSVPLVSVMPAIRETGVGVLTVAPLSGDASQPALQFGFAFTVMVTVDDVDSTPSVALNCSTYVPAVLNAAAVFTWLALSKTTVPGPLCMDHVEVTVLDGSPSSLTEPLSTAFAGN